MHTHNPQKVDIPTEQRITFVCENCDYEYPDCLTYEQIQNKHKLLIFRRSPHYHEP